MEFLLYFIEIIKFAVLYRMGFGLSFKRTNASYIILICSWVGLSTYMTFFKELPQSLFVYLFAIAFISVMCMDYNKKKVMWISLWSATLIGLLDTITQTTLEVTFSICGIENILYKELFLEICALLIIYLMFFFIHKYNKYSLLNIPLKYFIFLFFDLLFDMLFIALVYELVTEKFWKYLWVFYGVSWSVFLQVFFVLLLSAANAWQIEKDKLNQQFLKKQEEHYRYLEQREENTRKFRHDMRNHLYIMEQLCKANKIGEVEKYIEEIYGGLGISEKMVSTHNNIVDAVINQFVSTGREKGIAVMVKGHMPLSCRIQAFDLCCIFSNILQNAIEAVELCVYKKVKLILRYDSQFIYVQEENDYVDELQFRHGKLLSKKANREFHGYGLTNIEESVEKYQGEVEYHTENGHFQIMLSMHYR